MNEVALEFNLPVEVVEAIYNSQNNFIRTEMFDKTKTINLHIGGLGKFYSFKDRKTLPPRNGFKTSADYRGLEKPSNE